VAANGNRRVDRRRLGPPVALEALATKGLGCRYVGLGGAARWSCGLPQRQGDHEEGDEQGYEAIWRGHRLPARHGVERRSSVGDAPPSRAAGPVRTARARNGARVLGRQRWRIRLRRPHHPPAQAFVEPRDPLRGRRPPPAHSPVDQLARLCGSRRALAGRHFNNRDKRRSASTFPPVWHSGQY
jgi:hypothetical protein